MKPIVVLLALLGAGCAHDAGNTCKMGHVTDLPLAYRGVLITPATLNDQPASMMIDTGAMLTIIRRDAAKRLKLSLQTTNGWISGVGGSQDLYLLNARRFSIGQLHGANLTLAASDIGMSARHSEIDGIFGADFLAGYELDFDLPERKLRLFKVVEGCNVPAARLDEPLYTAPLVGSTNERDVRAHVMVTIDGIRLNAVVDSGAQRTAIFRNSANRLGLRLADLTADPHGQGAGIGPKLRDEVRHIMAPIQVGEITISHLPVSIIDQRSAGDTDMLLGLDFLARIHVWLSFHSRTLFMQYPPKPSPPVAGDR